VTLAELQLDAHESVVTARRAVEAASCANREQAVYSWQRALSYSAGVCAALACTDTFERRNGFHVDAGDIPVNADGSY